MACRYKLLATNRFFTLILLLLVTYIFAVAFMQFSRGTNLERTFFSSMGSLDLIHRFNKSTGIVDDERVRRIPAQSCRAMALHKGHEVRAWDTGMAVETLILGCVLTDQAQVIQSVGEDGASQGLFSEILC